MSNRKQPKPDTLSTVITEIEEDHYRIKNWVAKEWSLILGPHAMHLYNIYCAAANRELGNKWFFSIRTLEEFTLMHHTTIIMNNWLLELCGLIRVNAGAEGYANEYILLTPSHVTDEILKQLVAKLKVESDVGKNWRNFKANVLERIMKWKPLHECGKASQFKKGMIEAKAAAPAPTNEPTPPAPSADLPRQTKLVAYMTETFYDGKKPLSEAAAMKMIEQYGMEAVERQISWLERRDSDNPLRTLRAALKDDWNEPKPIGQAKAEPFTPADMAVMTALDVTRMNEANEPPAPAPESPPPDPLWQEVKERLQMQMTQATFDSCVRSTELVNMEGNQWVIQCESTFAQEWLVNRLNGTLTRTANSVAGQEVTLQFIVRA